jgi:DNA processing protein
VSEFPPGTPPLPGHFPRRNRVISGLAVGTLVVEAALKSGSLITARLAVEQGREVFAIPGSIHNPLARGCHALIRQGAKLVETADDIAEELGAMFAGLSGRMTEPAAPQEADDLLQDPEYGQLLAAMGHDPMTVDGLVARTGFAAEAVSSMLLLLELRGHVLSNPGGFFTRNGAPPE